MSEESLIITSSISPFDITILFLIYDYCFEFDVDTRTSIDVFLTLITPTFPTVEHNPLLQGNSNCYNLPKPVYPTLIDLYEYLKNNNYEATFRKLMSMLLSINNFDSISYILNRIETECLVKTNKEARESKRIYKSKKVVKSSLLGIFITRSISRYAICEFDEKNRLWKNYQLFVKSFTELPIWKTISGSIEKYDGFQKVDNNFNEKDDSLVKFLDTMTTKIFTCNQLGTMISHNHFQSILNWEVYNVSQFHKIDKSKVDIIFNHLPLHDSAKFPTVHLLKYLIALEDYCYQDALTSLHNYFDYMLTQNADNYFHISLLGLGACYAYFHDCESAIKSYTEATKVAREYKDSTILNLIMLWIVEFIQEHPEYTNRFQVMINQIVRYLKTSNENEASFIFGNAYKFETFLKMSKNDSSIEILESRFKYAAIAHQSVLNNNEMDQFLKHSFIIWDYFGSKTLTELYRNMSSKTSDSLSTKIANVFENSLSDLTETLTVLRSIHSPNITYQQQMGIKLIKIRYLLLTEDYQQALDSLPTEKNTEFMDFRWRTTFELEKCNILIASKNGIRSLSALLKLIDILAIIKNPKYLHQALVQLVQIMKQQNKTQEAQKLFNSNIALLLYYNSSDINTLRV
ncbi:hypothetical protein TPHA_0D01340 [Tetrapisispora phaffii CBS 4417]|uniref:Anaphase-promoting complex subunit 5 n=1 Tax=Tetrapisispora phaffii (strain ATCC 24235 / CBS 4417 / NBRC 1672 / NRRL Y-8282 / UCD 70-5) TaxID=1071381 RepID=G8BSF4_TETPH|nr:hypothetical protein TPHA_0D01340 [Tetrapisispora phaffii CBS 4417]CCE62775.1 hypothetical protein TPHA_0D01340 [Tetrapisispora phaffii CBS 4417]